MSRRDPEPVDAWLDVSGRAARATAYRPVTARGSSRSGAWSLVVTTVALAVIATGLALRPAPGATSGGPISASADDGMFRLQLTTPRDTYGRGEAIEPVATLTYLGPDPDVTIFHATHPIGFRIEEVGGNRAAGGGIEEVGGNRAAGGGTRLPCRSTVLTKGDPITERFQKGGSPDEAFDQPWYEDPVLTLPPGTWTIVAMLYVTVGDTCRGDQHRIEVANVIRVIDDAPPPSQTEISPPSVAPTPTPTPATAEPVAVTTADGAFRLDLSLPSSRYSTNDAIDPFVTLTYIGPEASTEGFHAASPIGFRIDEVGGTRVMDGGMDLPCLSTVYTRGAGKAYPFEKSGSPTDDPVTGFDRAWYEDPVLRLPAGQWRILAQLDVSLGGCSADAERHQLALSAEVTVIPASAGNEPVNASKTDGTLRLTLTTPHGTYGPTDAIEPIATIAYLGPDAETTIYTGDPPVVFSIQELGGGRRMDASQNLPCLQSVVDQAAPLPFAFVKSGVMTSFDEAWYADPVLRLPVGMWRIRARLDADTTDGTDTCGGIPHTFDVDNIVEIVPDGAPIPTTDPSPSPFAARADGPDASVALEIARKFEDGLATGHADISWRFLSPWSQASVGSQAEFEALFGSSIFDPATLEIGPPSQDPALLTAAFLGPRGVDLALHADPARMFLVPVRDPAVDGAAAGTTNLVVAALPDGTWEIWLDR